MTELTAAALVAMVLSFVVFTAAAAWYAVPRMRAVALAAAITPLLWIHAFRYVALQLISAQEFGFAIPDLTRDQIVFGDLIGMRWRSPRCTPCAIGGAWRSRWHGCSWRQR
jgi:hypothetical protein